MRWAGPDESNTFDFTYIPQFIVFYPESVGYNAETIQTPQVDGIKNEAGEEISIGSYDASTTLYFPTFLNTVSDTSLDVVYTYSTESAADYGVVTFDSEGYSWTFQNSYMA